MKNIQDFKTFLLEINRFKEKAYLSGGKFDHGLDDYVYSVGEIVKLQHPSWKESYDFKVTVAGKKPSLKQIDGPREIILERPNDFSVIIPGNLEKPKPEKSEKIKSMTQIEFKRLCKELISGHEYDDHSIFYDLAENQVKTDKRLREYLEKILLKDYSFRGLIRERI
jgi:hypothetical protein